MKGLLSTFILFSSCVQALPQSANPRQPTVEQGLRRTILIAGRENERFTLVERMTHYRVPGVSIAVIENCQLVDVRGFGRSVIDGDSVTAETLFQAGSISKPVTAVGALRLVEEGALSLDADVREQMTSWRLPDSLLLSGHSVTLRGLLSHTAGLNVEGMNGYEPAAPLPTAVQILDAIPPSNTPAIRIDTVPGTQWRYSGGGYVVTQLLMTDATGEAFPDLMHRLVLAPAGMTNSSYLQPLPPDLQLKAAHGTNPDGSAMAGFWRIYPEMAAAGLWTTPTDLARFAIAIARSIRGENGGLLRAGTARQMMERGLGNWGIGVDLGPPDAPRRLSHTGHSYGFTPMVIIYPDTCQGAVVMTNGDEGGWLIQELMRSISDTYGWPENRQSEVRGAIELTDEIATRFVGTYHLRNHPTEKFSITRKLDGSLYWAREGHVGRDLQPEEETKLFSPDSVMSLEASESDERRAMTLKLSFGGGTNFAERVE